MPTNETTSTTGTCTADEAAARQLMVAYAQRFAPSGLSQGTSGNLSMRWHDGEHAGMLITPSGVDYTRLGPGDLAFMRLDDASWSGPLKPSSEWRFHRDIYVARPETGAVVHAHPTHATAVAVQRRDIPAFHYMVAVAGGRDIRCAPYATYGTEALSQHALHALADRRACLLANHGLIAVGADLAAAFALAQEVEELSRQYLLALAVGQPVVLPDDEMDRVLEAFKSYGANAQKGCALPGHA
ncbi:class II aldolase/adducin family protein (plasmid) [Burkholderia humptydooensis]|uniref:Class II aldolase/adducin family protein n=3 Tax=Burkholderiaceae TaxID=119060 RepID=A0A7T2TXX4_9BURK|nr:class II aldolase/adducin family protein [Burkholderia humptydooensis]